MTDARPRPRQQSLASRRSRPELDLSNSFPQLDIDSRQAVETPLRTPDLEGSAASSSPPERTPSPAQSAGGPMRRLGKEEVDTPPSPIAPLLARAGKRPSFSRSQSAFDSNMQNESYWPPVPSYNRMSGLAAREMSMPRRSSDGMALLSPRADSDARLKERSTTNASSVSSFAFSAVDLGSHGHSRNPTVSSTFASTFNSSGPLTPSDEDAVNAAVRFSWGPLATQTDARRLSEAMRTFDLESGDIDRSKRQQADHAAEDHSVGLMGKGSFGPGVRQRVAEVLDDLLDGVPLEGEEDEVIALCEYGALNSRSATLMTEVVSRLARRHHDLVGDNSNACFYVTHADMSHADFRPVSADLEHSDSYTSSVWQMNHAPPLVDRAFSAFAGRPRHAQVLPAKSVSAGISLFDLHWGKGGLHSGGGADAELSTFLRNRAAEFRHGGLLVMAFIQRSEEPQSNRPVSFGSDGDLRTSRAPSIDRSATIVATESTAQPTLPKRDLWSLLTRALAPCIQRLVSCGMIKSDVARHLLALPDRFYPRTPKQTAAVLHDNRGDWTIEYSAGLADELALCTPATPRPTTPLFERKRSLASEDPLILVHPASKALKAGLMGPKVYAEHAIQLVKTLYEHHFRGVLSKRGKLSRSATEWVCDSLFDILREKIEEGELTQLELEVTLVALRRT